MGAYFRMEQKFGHLGISGLVRILAFFKVITFLIFMAEPGFYSMLLLDMGKVLQGEVWRLLSFLFVPSSTNGFIIIFEIMFLLMIGEGLEQAWGPFGVTLYIASSALCGIFACLILSTVVKYPILLNSAVYASLLMAASCLYPDMVIQLALVIPVKMKWIGVITGGFLLYQVFLTTTSVEPFLGIGVPLAVCLIPFLVVFVPGWIKGAKQRSETAARRSRFEKAKLPDTEAFHKCDLCGATEISEPDREFRVNASGQEVCSACRTSE